MMLVARSSLSQRFRKCNSVTQSWQCKTVQMKLDALQVNFSEMTGRDGGAPSARVLDGLSLCSWDTACL